ncbi:MAG: methyltransferase domain-containing protein [Phycisphaeraceae bacterium]
MTNTPHSTPVDTTAASPAPAPSDQPAEAMKIIGSRGSHDAIRRVFAGLKPGKVLDIPAGEGIFAQFLLDRGWDVHCSDIDAGNFKLNHPNLPFKVANLNEALPYDDECFDVVACVNGLHRLYNPGGAIREFHRILKPNGTLYINVNNYASIKARLRFLVYGSINNAVNEGMMQQTIDDPEAHVRHYLMFPQIANQLGNTGFQVIDVWGAAIRASRWLSPAAWMIRLLTRAVPEDRARRNFLRYTASRAVLQDGEYMLIEARKTRP